MGRWYTLKLRNISDRHSAVSLKTEIDSFRRMVEVERVYPDMHQIGIWRVKEQGRLHGSLCRGRLDSGEWGRGSIELGRGS